MKKKLLHFFDDYRLLDGYLHILCATLHYRALATYSTTLYILSLTFTVFRKTAFAIHIEYNSRTKYLPPIEVSLTLFGHRLIDNGRAGKQALNEWYEQYTAERKERKRALISDVELTCPQLANEIKREIGGY